MYQWGICRRVRSVGKHGGNISQLPSCASGEEDSKGEVVLKTVKIESLMSSEFMKRKRCSCSQLTEIKGVTDDKQKQNGNKKWKGTIERWPLERYKLAEKNMFEVLKAEGATFANPISRSVLRTAARKCIGDTGLLDHLLKHIDGKLAPGGTERFRRWFNPNGIMEYWLESADLNDIRHESGVEDPFWIPPSRFMPGGGISSIDSSTELSFLKAEMAKIKRDMQELESKQHNLDQTNLLEGMHKELVKWKAITDQRLTEMTSSLNGIQGMYGEMLAWKTKVEQQLAEITNSLNKLQASKEYAAPSTQAESWEDWLESSNLDNIQGGELVPWFDNTDLFNVEQEGVVQDLTSAPIHEFKSGERQLEPLVNVKDLQLQNNDIGDVRRDTQAEAPNRQEEYQANVTPDSSATMNSKSDIDSSVTLFQDMFMQLFNWKDRMEQQLLEVSNTVYGMLQMK